jgi:hypothetical protein
LEAIVPDLAVPVQPLLEGSSRPYAMFKGYWKYEWVRPVYRYDGLESLLGTLAEKVIAPAESKMKALAERRRMIEAELTSLSPRSSPTREATCFCQSRQAMAQEDHWLPGFNFNVEEWDAEGLSYETLAICRTLALARAVLS